MAVVPTGVVEQTVDLDVSHLDAVVFDMDGVITDTASVHAAAWKQMFDLFLQRFAARTRKHIRPFDNDDYLRYVDGKHRDDGVESFLRSRGIRLPRGDASDSPDQESVWGLANRKNEAFQRVIGATGVKPFVSSVELVRKLQARGIGTAVISASRNCQQVLDAAGIGSLFPVRVDGVEMEQLSLPGKPSPAVFIEATRRLATTPDRAAVIEDAIAGVEAGRKGHFGFVLGIDRHGGALGLITAGADAVVDDLARVRVVP